MGERSSSDLPTAGDGIHDYRGDSGDIQGSSHHEIHQTDCNRRPQLSATLIGTSLVLPVEALAGERGNRVSRNAGNRQGNRQSARSNRQTNRFAGPQNRQTSRQTNRGNRTTTFNENRQTRQTNRGGIDTNNRFPNREEAINNRTDRVTDRQDGRNHRVDSRQ